MNTKDLV